MIEDLLLVFVFASMLVPFSAFDPCAPIIIEPEREVRSRGTKRRWKELLIKLVLMSSFPSPTHSLLNSFFALPHTGQEEEQQAKERETSDAKPQIITVASQLGCMGQVAGHTALAPDCCWVPGALRQKKKI